MQDVTVNDGWHKITFHSEDGNSEYHKVMWGRLGYGNWDRVDDRLACGDTFEPAICMTVTEHDALNADRARLVAQITRLSNRLVNLSDAIEKAGVWHLIEGILDEITLREDEEAADNE